MKRWGIWGLGIVAMVASFGCVTKSRLMKAYNYYNLGNSAFYDAKYIEAFNYYVQAEKMSPRDPDIQQMLGMTYFARKDFNGRNDYLKTSESYLLKAISRYGHYTPPREQEYGRLTRSDALVNLSAIYLEMGRYDDAIARAQEAINDPTYRSPDRANYNIGVAYQRKAMPQRAVQYLNTAITLNRTFPGGHKTLGEVYLDLRRYPEAVSSFKEAVNLFPKYSEAYYLMGIAYQKQHLRADAQKTFKRCRDVDPEGAFGKKCRAFLR